MKIYLVVSVGPFNEGQIVEAQPNLGRSRGSPAWWVTLPDGERVGVMSFEAKPVVTPRSLT